jgi:WD40 repeat protein
MDISSDSTLLASGSADKNLKIWGLDFGECHRSLFAHGDSVMAVAFQPNTHYVFTASERCTSARVTDCHSLIVPALVVSACLTSHASVPQSAIPRAAAAVSA